ncbi:phosphatidylinositol N-acetylglucosaminyltransferase [Sanghuangporus baumii]|uniref:Phosphatidylinositol N-acetylglucosaminyltransferase n=1 Tax=Sanghuangporus baumii TaxID=108892 RepID=A0A9Q5MYN4_SANBA|nr:phosphatidylinositol N-acetylglucosaminyltransferase [Sanghuangporus baumii]
MGNLCSKPGTLSGGHTVLGGGQTVAPSSPRNESPEERRAQLAEAARQRMENDKNRLINKNNPNAGRLASQVNKPVKHVPQQKEPEPLRWMSTEWEKVLWKKQPYPDNYIPDSFLSSLRRNANFRPYTYWPLVLAACTISQHISSIFIFLVTFVRLYDESWDPRILVWICVGMFLLGLILWELLERCVFGYRIDKEQRAKTFKSSILVFLALLALSPVLRTLSASTSSDSIWALTACLFMLNILLADYGPSRSGRLGRERLTSVLSINAAMSASVVLASRLRDDISVFALMLFSIQVFALLPMLRTRLLMMPSFLRALLTVSFAGVSIHLTSGLSQLVTGIQAVILGFITFGAPWVLVWAQKFKNEIRGPWDVAIPQVR